MNVYDCFEGDDDVRLMWVQHDCYGSTLGLIRKIIVNHYNSLCPESIDHRSKQTSHDILAAVFRYDFKNSSGYKKYYKDNILGKNLTTLQRKNDSELVVEWQCWLSDLLSKEHKILKNFNNIYENQTIPEVHKFEEKLEVLLLKKFIGIPWTGHLHNVLNTPQGKNVPSQGLIKSEDRTDNKQHEKFIFPLDAVSTELYELILDEKSRSILALMENPTHSNNLKKMFFLKYNLEQKLTLLKESEHRLASEIELGKDLGCINWGPEAFTTDYTGWSLFLRHEYKSLKAAVSKKLPAAAGFCYVLGVVGKDEFCKIGFTKFNARKRAEEYGREHALDLYVFDSVYSKSAAALEKLVHQKLACSRVLGVKAQELFKITPEEASVLIRSEGPEIVRNINIREARELKKQEILLRVKISKMRFEIDEILQNAEKKYQNHLQQLFADIRLRSRARYVRRFHRINWLLRYFWN